MSLRWWSSYVAPKPPKGAQKGKTAVFRVKSHIAWKKVYYKVSLCENCQRQSCKGFIGLTIRAKMIGGGRLLLCKNLTFAMRRFSVYFSRSASAVTPSKKSSINTNRKSTTRFSMSLRWTSYVARKPLKCGSKTQSVQNLNNKLR